MAEDNPLYTNLEKIKKQIDRVGEITKKLMATTRYETKDYLNGKIFGIERASA